MQYTAKEIEKGYILTNKTEKYLIHKSIKKYEEGKDNKKYAPYYLKDLNTNKHISGLFITQKENPTFTYYTDDKRIDITINSTEAVKSIRPKKQKK